MESFAIYLIKVNIALIVLYAFYKLSFSKDTFFRLRRIMLLLICVTSLIYPLIDFSGWDGRVCNRRNVYYRLQ